VVSCANTIQEVALGSILVNISSTDRPFEMNKSPKEHLIYPFYEDDYDYKTTLRESFQDPLHVLSYGPSQSDLAKSYKNAASISYGYTHPDT